MEGHNIVAIYGSRSDAERARDRLIEIGIPGTDIRMSADDWGLAAGTAVVAGAPAPTRRREGFWDWLFGRDVPEGDRSWYEANLREGRTALSVFARDAQEQQRVAETLEEFDPIDIEDAAGAGLAPLGSADTWSRRDADSTSVEWPAAREASIAAQQTGLDAGTGVGQRTATEVSSEEQKIPVVSEELAVGKRASERRYRIRTYVVETPVEKEITLRDERVVVERRPVSDAAANAQIPQEREYEVVERHEEPVVEKRARNVEEVVVRTDANERTEKVRDTVRQTKVDVENEAGGRADNLERAIPADRKA